MRCSSATARERGSSSNAAIRSDVKSIPPFAFAFIAGFYDHCRNASIRCTKGLLPTDLQMFSLITKGFQLSASSKAVQGWGVRSTDPNALSGSAAL